MRSIKAEAVRRKEKPPSDKLVTPPFVLLGRLGDKAKSGKGGGR